MWLLAFGSGTGSESALSSCRHASSLPVICVKICLRTRDLPWECTGGRKRGLIFIPLDAEVLEEVAFPHCGAQWVVDSSAQHICLEPSPFLVFQLFQWKFLRCGPKSELCNFTSRDFLRIKHPDRTEFQWCPQHSLLVSPVSPDFVWSCAWGRPVSSGANGSAPSICMLPSTGQDSGKAEDFLQESGQLFYGDCGSLFCQSWESDMGHVCLRHLFGRVLKIIYIFLIKSHSSAQSNSPDVWLYFGKIYMQIM